MQGIGSLLKLKPGEGRRTLILFLLNFCVVAVTIAGKSARDTFFLSRYNKSYLPLMFVACAVMVAMASAFYGRVSGKVSRSTLFNSTSLAFAGVVVLLGMHIAGWVIPAFYGWIEIVVSVTTMQLWMLASDTFDPRQAKRIFGIIGGGGSLAAAISRHGTQAVRAQVRTKYSAQPDCGRARGLLGPGTDGIAEHQAGGSGAETAHRR